MKMLKNKKGQGAMEYLMTYGWAILVVLIVGIVLWQLGIFSFGSSGKGYSNFGQVKPTDWTADDIVFLNGVGTSISNFTLACTSTLGGTCDSTTACTVAAPSSAAAGSTIRCDLHGISGAACVSGKFKYNMTSSYIVPDTGLTHKETGTIWGPC